VTKARATARSGATKAKAAATKARGKAKAATKGGVFSRLGESLSGVFRTITEKVKSRTKKPSAGKRARKPAQVPPQKTQPVDSAAIIDVKPDPNARPS
jgi:hypothetical protein